MAVYVDIDSQLDLFGIIKGVLQTNSTLNAKFKDSSFLEFEPNLKSTSFQGLPYILIDTPEIDPESYVNIKHSEVIKAFDINIVLVISYEARDKFKTYASAILSQLDQSESIFESHGYYNLDVGSVKPEVELIQEKQVITGTITVSLSGVVER